MLHIVADNRAGLNIVEAVVVAIRMRFKGRFQAKAPVEVVAAAGIFAQTNIVVRDAYIGVGAMRLKVGVERGEIESRIVYRTAVCWCSGTLGLKAQKDQGHDAGSSQRNAYQKTGKFP